MSDRPLERGVFHELHALTLQPDPIRPEWVLDGQPEARSARHSTNTDGWAATHLWECSAGRFHWHYEWEETVLILDGEVRVTDAYGDTSVLGAGSVGYFPQGSWWVWEVPQQVLKLSFNRRAVQRPARALSRLLDALRPLRKMPPPLAQRGHQERP